MKQRFSKEFTELLKKRIAQVSDEKDLRWTRMRRSGFRDTHMPDFRACSSSTPLIKKDSFDAEIFLQEYNLNNE
jgi:hypothetical protein